MKNIDASIIDAFKSLREKYHTNTGMAKDLGISDSLLSRVINGKAKGFSDSTWKKIENLILPHIRRSCYMGLERCPIDDDSPAREIVHDITEIKDVRWYIKLKPLIAKAKQEYFNELKIELNNDTPFMKTSGSTVNGKFVN